ncbi:MAG: hypothetical protein J6R30_08995 [Bacteroidales bacterium]|nr:hypothetical protein [Bacteroidales bacterium]
MRKIFKSLFVIAASAVAFAGCAKQEVDTLVSSEAKTVQFIAQSIETKTAFGAPDGVTYPTLWTENDKSVKLLLNLNEEFTADVVVADDFKTASFNAEIQLSSKQPSTAPYTFYAMSPSAAYLGHTAERYSATIPASQTPSENSVDEAAQILYAVSEEFTEIPESVYLNFKHFTAYGKLSFDNLELAGAKVTSVSISSPDIYLAGRWNYIVADGTFTENSGANEITLSTEKTQNLWFACAPVGSMNGKTLKFTVNTDKGTIAKEVKISGNYSFTAGRIANMHVDMAGLSFAASKIYELVTDVDELTAESKIIVVANDYDLAMSTTQNKNNRGEAGITKQGNNILNPGDGVQIISLEKGAETGTVAFNVGDGYLYAAGGTSTNNYLKTKAEKDVVSSWDISISADGVATIKCADGSVVRNTLMYNSGNKMFSCYASGQKDVAIYKLQGSGTGSALIVPGEDESTPTYASLADLVNAGQPTAAGTKVNVTLTNEKITGIYVTSSGYRNGVFLMVGNQEIEIYSRDVPTEWEVGGTISGTLKECVWKLYNTTWELCPSNWSELTYIAPESGSTEPDQPGEGGGTEGNVVLSEQFDNSTTSDSSAAIGKDKFPNFSGDTDKAYTSKYGGLKLGSSKAVGYITSKSLDLSSSFTVQIDACKYGSDTGSILVTVGTVTKTIPNGDLGAAGSFKTFTLSFDAATTASTVKIATTSKRAYIDNVVITKY